MKRFNLILLSLLLFTSRQLHAQISASVTSGCAPLVGVTFSSPSGASNIDWQFGDGTSANISFPSHTYTLPGTYVVHFTAIVSGNNVSDSLTINVFGKPSPYFRATTPNSGCLPLTVTFLDSSFGGGGTAIIKREWAFGDGGVNIGNDANPSYTYTLQGTFNVTLKITDANGCDSSFVRTAYVNTSINPTATLNSNPNPMAACVPPLTVTLTGSNSVSHSTTGSTALTYLWTFGNGDSSTVANPPPVTYSTLGNFGISLTVTDNNGCSKTTYSNASVMQPIASFYADSAVQDTVCKTVKFVNQSTVGIYTYTYGDGISGVDTFHTYAASGTYNVKLQVQAGGCVDDTTITIVVENVAAHFTSTPAYSCSYPSIINYTNTSVNAVMYQWLFYDSTKSTLTNPIDTIIQTDFNPYTIFPLIKYNTQLTAISAHGCRDSIVQRDTVYKPTALLAASVAYGCAPMTVVFSDSSHSLEPITSRTYIFDDGGSHAGNDTTTTHTYTAPGIYHPYIIITNSRGCPDTSFTLTIYVGSPPSPSFSLSPSPVCVHTPVQFTNLTPLADSVQWIHYNADGGMMSHCYTDPNPTWSFDNVTGAQNITIQASYNGCIGSSTLNNAITIKGPLVHFYPVNDCDQPFVYSFKGRVSDAANWTWDFGDGQVLNTTSDTTPSHTYAATGDYNVKLIGFNPSTGCQPDSEMHAIHVRDLQAIISTDTNACVNGSVLFSGGPSQDVNPACHEGYLWYWNDGSPPHNSQDSTTTHAFGSGGDYSVKLVVTDINGCKDSVRQNINVFDIQSKFSVDKNFGCLPLTINFTDSSFADTTLVHWQWSFGDGGTSQQQSPTHTYTQAPSSGGRFTVTLTVTDTIGCSRSFTKYITPSIPDSLFGSNIVGLCAGDSVHFLPNANVPGYMWYFGDGDSSSLQRPWHEYANSGIYTVRLVVTDSIGCKNSRTVPAYINVQDYPQAGFVSTADTIFNKCYPLLVNYTDTSINVAPGVRTWDLGNGSQVITAQTVGTIYQAPGSYTVSLIVQTTFGCKDTVVKSLSVEGPTGNFNILPNIICKGQSVTFSIKDTSDLLSYIWDFGDGTDTLGISPVTHTFNINPSSGQTNIGLVMWSPDSACTATHTNILNIHPVIADFAIANNDSILCLNEVSIVTNQSLNATSYNWNFGNGIVYTDANPQPVTYNTTGIYYVTLTINDNVTGCRDTMEKKITVAALPQAVATGGDTCQGFSVQLLASGGKKYLWQPATYLSNDTLPNPVATPPVSITYTVQVTDTNGCRNTESVPVIIYQPSPEVHMDTTIVIGSPVLIGFEMPDPGYIYTWNPSTYLSCSTCPIPMSHVLENTNYDFTVTDGAGCFTVTSTYDFIIKPVTSIDVPTAFTPNGDHENDVIYVNGWGIKQLLEFKIYNRWGQLVFESTEITEGWDGYYKGELQPQDTYVYQAEVETWISGQKLKKKGMFELIR